jgi:protein-arginine kinase activator protein McsA
MQEFLQHLFGFIGILTVVNWVYKLFALHTKKQSTPLTTEDLMQLRSKNECPECSSPLSPMRSTSLKECTSCYYKEEWKLDKGQLPLIANNRMVKRDGSKKD